MVPPLGTIVKIACLTKTTSSSKLEKAPSSSGTGASSSLLNSCHIRSSANFSKSSHAESSSAVVTCSTSQRSSAFEILSSRTRLTSAFSSRSSKKSKNFFRRSINSRSCAISSSTACFSSAVKKSSCDNDISIRTGPKMPFPEYERRRSLSSKAPENKITLPVPISRPF